MAPTRLCPLPNPNFEFEQCVWGYVTQDSKSDDAGHTAGRPSLQHNTLRTSLQSVLVYDHMFSQIADPTATHIWRC